VEIEMARVCLFLAFGFQLSSLLHVALSVCLPTPFYTTPAAAAPKS